MRIPLYVRRLPRQPKLPAPTLTANDVKKALTEISQNQAAIMNEIAQIKNAMLWLNGQTFEAILEVAPSEDQAVNAVSRFFAANAGLTQAFSE